MKFCRCSMDRYSPQVDLWQISVQWVKFKFNNSLNRYLPQFKFQMWWMSVQWVLQWIKLLTGQIFATSHFCGNYQSTEEHSSVDAYWTDFYHNSISSFNESAKSVRCYFQKMPIQFVREIRMKSSYEKFVRKFRMVYFFKPEVSCLFTPEVSWWWFG